MALDVASLGFTIDSSALVRAKTDLNALADAARRTSGPVESVGTAATRASTGVQDIIARSTGLAAATRSASASTQEWVNELNRQAAAFNSLRASVDPAFAATQRYEAAVEQANAAVKAGVVSQQEANRVLDAVAQANTRAGQAMSTFGRVTNQGAGVFQRYGQQIQGTSYQLQDLAVQLSMGTSAAVALGQQLPQLLGGFGAMGALLGVGVAVLGGLAPALFAAGDAADKANESISNLGKAILRHNDAAQMALSPMADLVEQYGQGAGAARELYDQVARLSRLEAAKALRESMVAINDQMSEMLDLIKTIDAEMTLGLGDTGIVVASVERLRKEFGLTVVEAKELSQLITDARNAKSIQDQAQAMTALAGWLDRAERNGLQLTDAMVEFATQAAQGALRAHEVAAATDQANASTGAAVGSTNAWAAAMAGVAAQINAIASAISAIGGGMISRAAMFVERNALAAGKTVAQARVEVEKFKVANEWDAQIMGARAKGGIFGAVASKAMEAAKAVDLANVEMAAQNAIITQNAAAAERAAAKTGGGKKGRKSGGAAKLSDEAKAAQEATEALARLVQEHSVLQATLGMTETQERAYRAAMELGAGATDAQRLQVMQLVPEMARLEEQQQVIRDRAEAMQQGFREMFTGIISGAKSARDAIADMASKLAEMMANRAFDSLLAGGLGRFFGGDPLTAALSRIPGLATGGHINRGGWAMVGERGPELVHLPSRATVYDNRQTRGAMAGGAMTYAPVFNIGGNVTAEDLAAVRQESLANYHQMQRTMPAQVQRVNRDPLRR